MTRPRRATPGPAIHVTAAVVRRAGRYLVTRRRAAQHLAGLWEFPGGKRQGSESLEECLVREIREELGVTVRVGRPIAVVPWSYPDRRVVLHFFRCHLGQAPVSGREGQDVRWVTPSGLTRLALPPADRALVEHLTRRAGPGRAPPRGSRSPARAPRVEGRTDRRVSPPLRA